MTQDGSSYIEALRTAVPEAEPFIDPEWAEEGLAFLVFASGGFSTFVELQLRAEPRDKELVQRCFRFIEDLATDGTDYSRDLVLTGFLESIGTPEEPDYEQLLVEAETEMGPTTMDLWRGLKDWRPAFGHRTA